MFYVSYMLAELCRRKARTFLTALGLAIGVGLVVTVNALSTGLDRAQAAVLEPLTGVGTDLSVTRPIDVSTEGGGGGPLGLSERSGANSRRRTAMHGSASAISVSPVSASRATTSSPRRSFLSPPVRWTKSAASRASARRPED